MGMRCWGHPSAVNIPVDSGCPSPTSHGLRQPALSITRAVWVGVGAGGLGCGLGHVSGTRAARPIRSLVALSPQRTRSASFIAVRRSGPGTNWKTWDAHSTAWPTSCREVKPSYAGASKSRPTLAATCHKVSRQPSPAAAKAFDSGSAPPSHRLVCRPRVLYHLC